jgi:hypothetical protein
MKTYSLTSAARPPNLSKRQAETVYGYLENLGTSCTLTQLISQAESDNYPRLFKRPNATTVRASLIYHLNRFKNFGCVRVVEGLDEWS